MEMSTGLLAMYVLMSFHDDIISWSALIQLILSRPEALKTGKATGKPDVNNSILTESKGKLIVHFLIVTKKTQCCFAKCFIFVEWVILNYTELDWKFFFIEFGIWPNDQIGCVYTAWTGAVNIEPIWISFKNFL